MADDIDSTIEEARALALELRTSLERADAAETALKALGWSVYRQTDDYQRFTRYADVLVQRVETRVERL